MNLRLSTIVPQNFLEAIKADDIRQPSCIYYFSQKSQKYADVFLTQIILSQAEIIYLVLLNQSIIPICLLVLHIKFFFNFFNSRNDTFYLFWIKFLQFIFRYGYRLTA